MLKLATIRTAAILGILLLAGQSVQSQVPQPAPCHNSPSSMLFLEDFPPPDDTSRGFDVLSYDLEIILEPYPPSINGKINIGFQALDSGFQDIKLDLVSNLVCLEAVSGGQQLAFQHTDDNLLVHLSEPMALAQVETLTISWQGRPLPHGSFRAGLMFRHHHAGTPEDPSDDVPIIASVSETWSAHSWWPCKDHPADKALVSLTATVPDTLSLVSNGELLAVDTNEPGHTTYHWRESYPLPTYLVSVAASNYSVWSEDCLVTSETGPPQNIPLGFHVFPHDRPDGELDLALTCEAMNFLTRLAGPYPFAGEKYDQAEISWGGAMEHTTATSLPMMFFTGNGQFENLLVHEMSHHWFGNSLTPAVWADIWLNEGFARYCEALWIEQRLGSSAYLEFMQMIGPDHYPDYFEGMGLLADPDPILPNFLIYNKGAWLLHSLRQLLGDAVFFDLLKSYATDPQLQHSNVRTADFIARAEQSAGRSLDNFFIPWLETESVAMVHTDIQIKPRSGSSTLKIDFQQLQEVWLELAVPVRIYCGGSETDRLLVMRNRQQKFQLEWPCQVDSVRVDPDGVALMRQSASRARFLQVEGPWPNPLGPAGADFKIYLLGSSEISVAAYDARGRRAGQLNLGWYDATGPASEVENLPHTWHLPTSFTRNLPSGVYWFEFRATGSRQVKKAVLLR